MSMNIKELIKAKGGLLFFSGGLVFTNLFTTLIIATSLGFGLDLDVYYITLSLYLFLLASIGWSLTSVITPILIRRGVEESISSIFYIVLIWALLVVICLVLLLPFITNIIYSNYLAEYSVEFIYFLFLLSCSIFVIDLLAQVFVCFENASERFVRAISINFASSLVGLSVCYYFVENMGVVGALLAQLSIKVTLLAILLAYNIRFLSRIHYDRKVANELFSRAKYFFISGIYYRTEDLVEKLIASFLAPGFLSLVSFVQRIYGAVITVINTVIITPTLTRFCKSTTTSEMYSDHKLIRLIIVLICAFSLITFPLVYYFGEDFLLLIFAEKLLSVKESVAVALAALFPTFTFLTINQLLHNFLLSRSKEKKIAVFDMVSYTLSLLLKVALTFLYGFTGLLMGIVSASALKLVFKSYLVLAVIKNEK
ncbi:hypothetical protein WNY81_19405 [Shewanella frigidimarina]|uniref:hypothetical protein n=1 Tax=Shewanella frigidimarina TaxID=56812 RepID=UPI003171D976